MVHLHEREAMTATKATPAFVSDYQRMWDLVRQMRAELLDQRLITLEEYALLASAETQDKPGQGSPAPRRLENYDELRARFERQGQLAEGWRTWLQSVFLGGGNCVLSDEALKKAVAEKVDADVVEAFRAGWDALAKAQTADGTALNVDDALRERYPLREKR